MGARATVVKTGFKSRENEAKIIDNPYTHLAVSIILQAYNDLKALGEMPRRCMDNKLIEKWEIVSFFKSNWCGLLLSFQDSVTQEQLLDVVMKYFNEM